MTNTSDEEVYTILLKVMSNKDRFRIMNSVSDKPKTVTQICKDTGFEQTWVSHSLRLLRNNRMVETKREGKYIYYKLDRDIKPIISTVIKVAPKYRTKGG